MFVSRVDPQGRRAVRRGFGAGELLAARPGGQQRPGLQRLCVQHLQNCCTCLHVLQFLRRLHFFVALLSCVWLVLALVPLPGRAPPPQIYPRGLEKGAAETGLRERDRSSSSSTDGSSSVV